jgi:uncharacterized damage-inducible protein DinB
MTGDVLRLFYDYADWANQRIFDAAERLTQEQLAEEGTAGHGSAHQTLLHLLETQLGWFSWFDGSLPPEQAYGLTITMEEAPDVASLRERWAAIHAQAIRLIQRLSEDELRAELPLGRPGGPHTDVPLWELILHVANHGTQHRSEVAAMLTEHGHSPGNLDLLYYTIERNASAP